MSKCISWDIGIKNLAYCVLDSGVNIVSDNTIIFNNHQYDITHWCDISLVSQIESNLGTSGQVSHINNTLKCCAIKQLPKKVSKAKKSSKESIDSSNDSSSDSSSDSSGSESICGNSAFYCHEELLPNGEYKGICKTHFKKLTDTKRLPELSVKKCWHIDCSAKPIQVLKSHIFKGYCKKHINEMHKAKTHNDNDFLKINRAKTTSKIDINHLGIALFQELNKIKIQIVNPDIILLENQPVLKNPTMKSMQMFLYSYYLMQIMEGNDLANKKLQCYCASKKLDLIKFLPDSEQTRIATFIDTVNNSYQKNKKMSVMMVEVLLSNNVKWLKFLKKILNKMI